MRAQASSTDQIVAADNPVSLQDAEPVGDPKASIRWLKKRVKVAEELAKQHDARVKVGGRQPCHLPVLLYIFTNNGFLSSYRTKILRMQRRHRKELIWAFVGGAASGMAAAGTNPVYFCCSAMSLCHLQ